jgi:hypothetical protein
MQPSALASRLGWLQCDFGTEPDTAAFDLSWSQRFFRNILMRMGEDQWRDDLFIDCPTSGSLTVAEARTLIAAFIESHPVLRSVITDHDSTPQQRIVGAGSVDLAVVSGVSASWADLDGWVPRLVPDELPVGGALVIRADGAVPSGPTSGGAVSDGFVSGGAVSDGAVSDGVVSDDDPALAARVERIVLRISHRAADWWGIRLLRADLADRVRATEQREPLDRSKRTPSPAEVVAWEQSAEGQAAQERAAAYLTEQLAGAPGTMFPGAPVSYVGDRYWYGELRSSALLAALTTLHQRQRMLPATAFAGALAMASAAATGVPRPVLRIWSANRFNPAWRNYPGPLTQIGLLRIDVAPDEVLENWSRFNAAVLKACMHSRREPPGIGQGRDQIALNMLLGQGDLAADGAPPVSSESTFAWTGSRADGEDLGVYLLVYRHDAELVVQVRIGVDVLSKADAELMLRGMEWIIVETADRNVAPNLRDYRRWLCERAPTS